MLCVLRWNKRDGTVYELCQTTEFTISKISALLLQLEFSNIINSRPGKMYELA
jgi:predicted Rossmann fold nucleotide-binding protein DprA/Smf involved in DNA uptake